MEICELDIAAYRGKAIKVQYTTSYVYEAVVSQDAACFGVMFQRTALPKPLSCGFDDVWGSEWLKQPELYGVCVDGQIAGLLEICMENWTQRLRITNLFIEPAYREEAALPVCWSMPDSWQCSVISAAFCWKRNPVMILPYNATCAAASCFWAVI